jgi:hypothetical protein
MDRGLLRYLMPTVITMQETHKEDTIIGDAVLGRVSNNSLE